MDARGLKAAPGTGFSPSIFEAAAGVNQKDRRETTEEFVCDLRILVAQAKRLRHCPSVFMTRAERHAASRAGLKIRAMGLRK
jgi:hypothetical protein